MGDISLKVDWMMDVNDGVGPYMPSNVYHKRSSVNEAKLREHSQININAIEHSMSRLMYKE
jgi:hypothetical protein